MPQQKLPLFGGIIAPVHNGSDDPAIAATPLTIFTPPDKGLSPRGVQNYYELHLWLLPSSGGPDEVYQLEVTDDNVGADITLWAGNRATAFLGAPGGAALKILDGYPVRGNVTLKLTVAQVSAGGGGADLYPAGAQVWGYYYLRGAGSKLEEERRFIGAPSNDSDGLTVGLPVTLSPDEKQVLHTFENNRIDDVSLAFGLVNPATVVPGSAAYARLFFEDANGNDIIAGHQVNLVVTGSVRNDIRDPQSIYNILGIPMGNSPTYPNLHQISVQNIEIPNGVAPTMSAHGYFTRR